MGKITVFSAAKGFIALGMILVMLFSFSACGAGNKNSNKTNYGTVDWSTAAQGYITFTAEGQEYTFILQGPNGVQTFHDAAKDTTIKVALTDGVGRYQYAICNDDDNGKTVKVLYKNSFNVSKIDA